MNSMANSDLTLTLTLAVLFLLKPPLFIAAIEEQEVLRSNKIICRGQIKVKYELLEKFLDILFTRLFQGQYLFCAAAIENSHPVVSVSAPLTRCA